MSSPGPTIGLLLVLSLWRRLATALVVVAATVAAIPVVTAARCTSQAPVVVAVPVTIPYA